MTRQLELCARARRAAYPAIHYSCAPYAGRTGFSFERKHWCRWQTARRARVTQPPPSALADLGLVLVRGPDHPDLQDDHAAQKQSRIANTTIMVIEFP
jgi:hypothetical protein